MRLVDLSRQFAITGFKRFQLSAVLGDRPRRLRARANGEETRAVQLGV